MLAASANGTVVVGDVVQGMPVAVLGGATGAVRSARFDPTSSRVVGASWDGTARVWNATSPYRRWASAPIADDCGVATSLEPDRRFAAVLCRDHNTRIWDTAQNRLLAELPSVTRTGGDFAEALPAVSVAGDRAAIARGNTVEIYEVPGGRLVHTVTHDAAVSAVAFASTGRDLVTGGIDGSLRVTRDDRPSIDLMTAAGGIDAAAFLPDGRIAATDMSGRLRIHDASRAGLLADLPMPMRAVLLRISQNGRRLLTLASYMHGAAPALWDLERYQLVGRLEGHVGQVRSARLVREDREILTAGGDGTARLWDATTGRLIRTYHGSSRFFVDATLSPDGMMVVAGDGDGLLRFWEAATGQALWLLRAHKSHVVGVHFEGTDIVTRGFGGDLVRWHLPPPENIIGACDSSAHGNLGSTTACDMVIP